MKVLLIDFGATRVKVAVLDLGKDKITLFKNFNCPRNVAKKYGYHELSLDSLRRLFAEICEYYYSRVKFKSIALCSQMHGFVAFDKENKPLTEYVTWKDERSLEVIRGISTYDLARRKLGDRFLRITGMKSRPGIPFMNILHLARQGKLPRECKILSLPECLIDPPAKLVHETIAAGIGFYDISRKRYSEELISFVEMEAGVRFTFNKVTFEIEIAGYWEKIPVYSGVGDLQCAILGAGNKIGKTISINMGTGSQVSIIVKKRPDYKGEARPFFGKSYLKTVTHIPAGRALEVFLSLIDKKTERVWAEIKKLKPLDIINSSLKFNLSLFKSAWNYSCGGSIEFIHEDSFTRKNYLASLLRSFLEQYVAVSKSLTSERSDYVYILSGGIPRRLPVIKEVFSIMTKRRVIQSTNVDETILGLRKLAKNLIKIRNVIFDLDGTLVDSAQDIISCIKQSYYKCFSGSRKVLGVSSIKKSVVGPPIGQIIMTLTPRLKKKKIKKIIKVYRDIYDHSDFPKTKLYPGVLKLLSGLFKMGFRLFLVTNKPLLPTKRILKKLAIDCFEGVVTPDVKQTGRLDKEKMIAYLLKKWKLNKAETVFIGDSGSDVKAAHKNSLKAVGVLYGYGKRDEILKSNPECICKNVSEVTKILGG